MLRCQIWRVECLSPTLEFGPQFNHNPFVISQRLFTLTWPRALESLCHPLFQFILIDCIIMLLVHLIIFLSLKLGFDVTFEVVLFQGLPLVSVSLDDIQNLIFHFICVASVLAKSVETDDILNLLLLEFFVIMYRPRFLLWHVGLSCFSFFGFLLFLGFGVFFLFFFKLCSFLIYDCVVGCCFVESFFKEAGVVLKFDG